MDSVFRMLICDAHTAHIEKTALDERAVLASMPKDEPISVRSIAQKTGLTYNDAQKVLSRLAKNCEVIGDMYYYKKI